MNIKLLSMLAVVAGSSAFSQNVMIPDVNFKSYLITVGLDTNSDGEIPIAEARGSVEEIQRLMCQL